MYSKSTKSPLFILVGPSGAGKSSFLKKILEDFPEVFSRIITNTTRSMRQGEFTGNPYYFIKEEVFAQRVKDSYFLEWAVVHGRYYGTPKSQVEELWERGLVPITDLDIKGALSIKALFPSAITIFIMPPCITELKKRVMERDILKSDNAELRLRMENAETEVSRAKELDYQIVNDDFFEAYNKIKKLIEDYLNTL